MDSIYYESTGFSFPSIAHGAPKLPSLFVGGSVYPVRNPAGTAKLST